MMGTKTHAVGFRKSPVFDKQISSMLLFFFWILAGFFFLGGGMFLDDLSEIWIGWVGPKPHGFAVCEFEAHMTRVGRLTVKLFLCG